MAGGAGAAGPPPDVRHQPPGLILATEKDIPILQSLFWDIPKTKDTSRYPKNNDKKMDILFSPRLSFFNAKISGITRPAGQCWLSLKIFAYFGVTREIPTYTILIPLVYFPLEERIPVGKYSISRDIHGLS